METVKVKISDMAILQGQGVIITVGLGSCVGIAIYDPQNKIGGLAHILLPDSSQFRSKLNSFNPAKFADTAVPLLTDKLVKLGGKKQLFKAKIAGGGQLFAFSKGGITVGQKNIHAVRDVLNKLEIPIQGEDVGGAHGRTMRLFVDSGKVVISTVGKGETVL